MDTIPADDLGRFLTLAQADSPKLPHVGVVGDTYTILLTGKDTAGRYCLIDMHVPPGGGPPPHRHDFEESFTVLGGEIEATFRGKTSTVRAGESINIRQTRRISFRINRRKQCGCCVLLTGRARRVLFEVGVPVPTRTAPPPKPEPADQEAFKAKSASLAPKYKTELLEKA